MTEQPAPDAEPTDLPTALIELRHAQEEVTRLRPFVDMVDQAQRDAEPSDPTQRSGEEGSCPEHGYHRHSLKQPGGPDGDTPPALTAEEARDLADDLGIQLYRAQDALAFVEECCVIAEREGRTITVADVRTWLKGDRCTRQRAADRAATQAAEQEKTTRVFAALHRSAEADVTRVIDLYERWVQAGPPPLGTSMSRWWDRRLVELHDAIRPAVEQSSRTTVNNPVTCDPKVQPDA